MADIERERIEPFVVTREINLASDGIICAQCQRQLSKHEKATDTHIPSAEDLVLTGAVPIPNFGWFCSQACGNAYESASDVKFQRNAAGNISYY